MQSDPFQSLLVYQLKIENDYKNCGNLGLTASNILKLKTQTTFTAEKLH
uniref:Uncharacterized protein n=1 Tax=uncultured marine thaumarchaeote AD1000_66_F10 TaxID=1455930 RepID=A0A075G133_9ARCH|nr:hypothetical protein [uncultured marine thaumarchaeote AD1000_66_F10]